LIGCCFAVVSMLGLIGAWVIAGARSPVVLSASVGLFSGF